MHKNPITRTEKDFYKRVGQLGKEIPDDRSQGNTMFFVYDVIQQKNMFGEMIWHYRYILLENGEHRIAPVWTFTDCVVWLKDLHP